MDSIEKLRFFLKDTIRQTIDFRKSDQSRGIQPPPLQKKADRDSLTIDLTDISTCLSNIGQIDLAEAISKRKSRRSFSKASLSMEEISFLLWSTQGLRNREKNTPQLRTVPSAGARHSFETYLFINRVEKLPKGLYRYLPLNNQLEFIRESENNSERELSEAVFNQRFVADGAVIFIWTTIPYRMEWRYLQSAHRVILMDVGHVCQNLYLACEAINAGTCAIAAYDQEQMDSLLGVDGVDEFTLYLAPVGKY